MLKVSDKSIKKWLKKGNKSLKARKCQYFAWEPIEGFNLEPVYFTGTHSKPEAKVQKRDKIDWVVHTLKTKTRKNNKFRSSTVMVLKDVLFLESKMFFI
jgi:hypothetical protein